VQAHGGLSCVDGRSLLDLSTRLALGPFSPGRRDSWIQAP
jgi:hypothetical protein